MAQPIAKITGVALRPGVSLNRRLYSREQIARAVERAQARIAAGGPPLTMMSHHAAEDDSTRIVGRITNLSLGSDGEALYEAMLADTPHARTLLELIDDPGDGAYLQGVSIRGYWTGEMRRVEHDGQVAETGDELELDGLDFTKTPGVLGARVDTVSRVGRGSGPRESGDRIPIHETAEARVQDQITETVPDPATAQESSAREVVYADLGYRPDGQRRYPLDTRANAIEAWHALGRRDVALEYSSRQLKRARERTLRELQRHGVTVTSEGHLRTARQLDEAEVREFWPVPAGERADGGVEVCLYVGNLRVAVSSYCVDAHDLDRISRVAAAAAANCLAAVSAGPDPMGPLEPMEGGGKPDFLMDDDEDDDGEEKPDDDAKESASGAAPDAGGQAAESTTQAAPSADTPKEPAVADTNPSAGAGAPATTQETADQRIERLVAERVAEQIAAEQAKAAETARIDKLVAERLAAAGLGDAPAGAPAEETEEQRIERLVAEKVAAATGAAAVQETEEQRIQRLVDAQVTAAIQGHVAQNGAPARTGLAPTAGAPAPQATEASVLADGYPADWPRHADGRVKEMHELTETERYDHALPALDAFVSQAAKLRD